MQSTILRKTTICAGGCIIFTDNLLYNVGVRRYKLLYVACRDGYSSSNIVLRPAAKQAKWSGRKFVRTDVVIRDFSGSCARNGMSVRQNTHLITADRIVYTRGSR